MMNKKYGAQFVGTHAQHPELRTSAHDEVLLAFLDWLLESTAVALEETA